MGWVFHFDLVEVFVEFDVEEEVHPIIARIKNAMERMAIKDRGLRMGFCKMTPRLLKVFTRFGRLVIELSLRS